MVPTGWRAGPVAITGADGQVGSALQSYLAHCPNQVRPLGRGGDWAAAFTDAEVVIHLAGTLQPRRPNTYEQANLQRSAGPWTRWRVPASSGSCFELYHRRPRLRQPVPAGQRLGRSAAALLRAARGDLPLRSHLRPVGDPGPTAAAFLAKPGKPVTILGTGTQKMAPIYKADVVTALARAALDPATPQGTFELAGPHAITADQFAQHLNGHAARLRHLRPRLARTLGHVLPALPPGLVDVMLNDATPAGDPQETATTFGVHLHTLPEVWPPRGN